MTALPTRQRSSTSDYAHRSVAILLGCDHVGSAIAHRLHCDGFAVVVLDRIDPPWTRRGMSFVDAWYVGTAHLAGIDAIFCASVRSMPAVLWRSQAIAASAWSWQGVASLLAPALTVDSRAPSRRTSLDRSFAAGMLTIDVVPGAVTGPEFDVPVVIPPRQRNAAPHSVHARCAGRYLSALGIGDSVRRGDTLGSVGRELVVADASGTLCGLSARGAALSAGDVVAEIEPAMTKDDCFGLDPYAVAVAAAVSRAVADQMPRRRIEPARQSIGARYGLR